MVVFSGAAVGESRLAIPSSRRITPTSSICKAAIVGLATTPRAGLIQGIATAAVSCLRRPRQALSGVTAKGRATAVATVGSTGSRRGACKGGHYPDAAAAGSTTTAVSHFAVSASEEW